MKKSIISTTLVIFFIGNAVALGITHVCTLRNTSQQTNDTAKYLRNSIAAHSAKFEGKELNVLLSELNLTVKSYQYVFGPTPGGPPKCINLFFESSTTLSNSIRTNAKKVHHLTIFFKDPLSRQQVGALYAKSRGAWLDGEKSFYGNQIVKEVTTSKE